MVCGAVPLDASLRAGTEARLLRRAQRRVDVIARRDSRFVQYGQTAAIERVEEAVLGGGRYKLPPAARCDQGRRGGDIPIVKIAFDRLYESAQIPGPGVERHDGC